MYLELEALFARFVWSLFKSDGTWLLQGATEPPLRIDRADKETLKPLVQYVARSLREDFANALYAKRLT